MATCMMVELFSKQPEFLKERVAIWMRATVAAVHATPVSARPTSSTAKNALSHTKVSSTSVEACSIAFLYETELVNVRFSRFACRAPLFALRASLFALRASLFSLRASLFARSLI